jgi:hypothetical protein
LETIFLRPISEDIVKYVLKNLEGEGFGRYCLFGGFHSKQVCKIDKKKSLTVHQWNWVFPHKD